jgi:Adenylylsulphate kinase
LINDPSQTAITFVTSLYWITANWFLDGSREIGFVNIATSEPIDSERPADLTLSTGLFVEAGLITIVVLISPFRSERDMARQLVAPDEFVGDFRRHTTRGL